jgi:hypothetical protein
MKGISIADQSSVIPLTANAGVKVCKGFNRWLDDEDRHQLQKMSIFALHNVQASPL